MDWSVLGKMESHGKERKEVHRLVWRKGSKLSLCMIQIFLCWEKQAQGSLSVVVRVWYVHLKTRIIGWLIETKMQLLYMRTIIIWGRWKGQSEIRLFSACEWNRCRYPHQPITIHACTRTCSNGNKSKHDRRQQPTIHSNLNISAETISWNSTTFGMTCIKVSIIQ